jgi:hypothetical protein
LEPPFKIFFHYDERSKKNQGENSGKENNVKAQIPKFNSMPNDKTCKEISAIWILKFIWHLNFDI